MPPTHTIHADGHQLRTGFRAVGASGDLVLLAKESAFEVLSLRSAERRSIVIENSRGLSGATVVGRWGVFPTVGGWSSLRLDDVAARAVRLGVTEDDHPMGVLAAGATTALVFKSSTLRRVAIVDPASGTLVRSIERADAYSLNCMDDRGIAFGARDGVVYALSLETGNELWTCAPFADERIDRIASTIPIGHELHVRAEAIGSGGHIWRLARLDAQRGVLLSKRSSPNAVPAWLPDLAPAIEAQIVAYELKSPRSAGDLLLSSSPMQGIGVVVRADETAALIQLPFAPDAVSDGLLYGSAHHEGLSWLVAVATASLPLTDANCAVAVTPRSVAPELAGEEASVVMVMSAVPNMVVQHPIHGRINVGLNDHSGRPDKGETVLLEGVTVRPGGVIHVEGYRRTVAREPSSRLTAPFTLPAAAPRSPVSRESAKMPSLLAPIAALAREARVVLPPDVAAVVVAAERDATLRSALATLGFEFEVPAFFEESEADWADALPLWTDEYGETVGFFRDGQLFESRYDEQTSVKPLGPSLVEAIRRALVEDEEHGEGGAATRAYVLDVLAALRPAV